MKVLVIEDDAKISAFLKKSLEAELFAVDVAGDGAEGAYLLHVNEYDIAILDNMLPKKEGIDVLREVRGDGIPVPVIVLSVKSETVRKIDLLNAGADDYLTKPFSFEELLARMRALLRRPIFLEGEQLRVADVVLDDKACTVMRAGREIRLTRKEFMLLRYLMRHAGTVLSRGMILEHVWDMNIDMFTNTVESHILSLRKKIGDRGAQRLIQTVPSRGYKIDERGF